MIFKTSGQQRDRGQQRHRNPLDVFLSVFATKFVRRGSFSARLAHWFLYRLGLRQAPTDLTDAERACLARHGRGRHALVEIGVGHGASTALLRSVMAPNGTVVGIDPFPVGRVGLNIEWFVARHEISKFPQGHVKLLRQTSRDAAVNWESLVDFLFIDGDHSWEGIDGDWRCWSKLISPGGLVALHDSRPVPWRPDLPSVGYTQRVIQEDRRFQEIDAVDSLTVLERVDPPVSEPGDKSDLSVGTHSATPDRP